MGKEMSAKKKILAIAICTIALLLLVFPVQATLQVDVFVEDATAAISYHNVIVDNDANDADPLPNVINLGNNFQPIPGYIVQGSYHTSKNAGLNIITSGSSTVSNDRANNVHAEVAVGDTDYTPPATLADVTGSGTFTTAKGSSILIAFYDDPLNVQGANSLVGVLTPGDKIAEFTKTATTNSDSFSFDEDAISVNDLRPYSMTLYFTFDLTPGGDLTSRGQSMYKYTTPAPEFPSLAVPIGLIIGLIGIVLSFPRKNEK